MRDTNFWKQNFDKLFVGVFVILSAFFLLHVMHHASDQGDINQAWGVLTFFLGLLSGLVTGRYLHPKDDSESPAPVSAAPAPDRLQPQPTETAREP